MKKTLILILIFFTSRTQAQGSFFLEEKICDSSQVIFYTDMIQRADGSAFVCGYYNVDSGTHQNPVLIKLDANHNEVMRKVYHAAVNREDQFWEIKLLPNNNLLVMGNLESKDGAFTGMDTNSLSCGRILVAELDTLGNFIKTKTYSYCGQTKPMDMVVDKKGNIYVCGHTISKLFDFSANPEGGMETNDFLIRLDTSFNSKWLEIFDAPGSQDFEPHICLGNNEDILFITSSNTKGGYFSANAPTPTGMIYITCLDSNKTKKWQKCYGSINNAIGTNYYEATSQIIYDSMAQNIYIIGFNTSKDGDMYESLDQNPFPTTESSYILKLDSVGNKIWCHRYGAFSASNPISGNIPYTIAFDGGGLFKNDHIYLLSEVMYSDANWTGIAVNNNQQRDQWLIKIDSLGVIKNKLRIGGEKSESAAWIKSNDNNNNILVGMISGSTSCNPINLGSYVIYECGVWPTKIPPLEIQDNDIKLVPNPTSSVCNIIFKEPTNEVYTLILSDQNGKKLMRQRIETNTLNYTLATQNLNLGVYLIQLKSKSKKIILKLIKY